MLLVNDIIKKIFAKCRNLCSNVQFLDIGQIASLKIHTSLETTLNNNNEENNQNWNVFVLYNTYVRSDEKGTKFQAANMHDDVNQ